MKPKLFYLMGIPGSGKTSFAKSLAKKLRFVHLSSDHMRHSMYKNPDEIPHHKSNAWTYGAMHYATHEILSAGYGVVFDANHNFRHVRDGQRKLAKTADADAVLIRLIIDVDTAVTRASTRKVDNYTRHLDEYKVRDYQRREEAPQPDEPHIEIAGAVPFNEQFRQFENQLKDLS